MTWIEDTNGNRCSVKYFGSAEAAQKALDSLVECRNCTNCSDLKKARLAVPDFGPPPVPVIPDIHKVIYAAASRPKALAMKSVHSCKNTHCRGGWIITLAGDAGRKLERFFGWELAAMKIYDASGYKINPARFYDSNVDALADMKRLAEM